MYPLLRWHKLRNYVIEWADAGWDLEAIRYHFVDEGKYVKQEAWDYLLQDPERRLEMPPGGVSPGQTNSGPSRPQPPDGADLEAVFKWCKRTPRDIDQHLDALREVASKVSRVTAITKRREDAVAWVAAGCESVIAYCTEPDPLHERLGQLRPGVLEVKNLRSVDVPEIEETDLLYIDSQHTMKDLLRELNAHYDKVTRFIVVRGSQTNGERGEDGGLGLLPALRRFMKENRELSVIDQRQQQYGMTILSKLPQDRPKLPDKLKMISNFTQAVAKHVITGAKQVTAEQLEARLDVCMVCPHRNERRCAVCGCFVAQKAKMKEAECPIGKWYDADLESGAIDERL